MDKICKVNGCGRTVRAKGYCGGHYARVRQHGDPQADVPLQLKGKSGPANCRIDGCGKPVAVKHCGLCMAHYLRQQRKGDAEAAISYIRGDDNARFWSYVDRSPGPDACHPWTGETRAPKRNPEHAYGRLKIDGRMVTATRYLVEVIGGRPLAAGEEILHTCDNPICLNPHHLRVGTHLDNMRDMDSKGRRKTVSGERAWRAKFTDEQVIEMRRRHAEGEESTYAMAKRFGVNLTTVQRIVTRQTWKHLP